MYTKIADSKGRISLGSQYSGKVFIVREQASGAILIEPAVILPEAEAWLFRNQEALASVKRGMEQASRRMFSDSPPDLEADRLLAAKLDD